MKHKRGEEKTTRKLHVYLLHCEFPHILIKVEPKKKEEYCGRAVRARAASSGGGGGGGDRRERERERGRASRS